MKRLSFTVIAGILCAATLSCKKSSSNSSKSETETVSFKITISPTSSLTTGPGTFTGSCNALLPNNSYATWKINGTTRANEPGIGLTYNDFVNGVLTAETTDPVIDANFDISGITIAQYPFDVTYVSYINGKVKDSLVLPVTSTMDRTFSY